MGGSSEPSPEQKGRALILLLGLIIGSLSLSDTGSPSSASLIEQGRDLEEGRRSYPALGVHTMSFVWKVAFSKTQIFL